MRYDFTGRRQSATSAERRARGQTCSRGCTRNFLFLLRVSGDFRADGAPPFVRGIGCPRPSAQSDSFAPRGRRGRAAAVGFLREASWPPLSGALLVLFSRQGEKSTQINLPDKLQFIYRVLRSLHGREGLPFPSYPRSRQPARPHRRRLRCGRARGGRP